MTTLESNIEVAFLDSFYVRGEFHSLTRALYELFVWIWNKNNPE